MSGLAQAQSIRSVSRQPFDLSYLPSQSPLVLGVRAVDLNALPEIKPLMVLLSEQFPFKVAPADVEQFLAFWLPMVDGPAASAPGQGRGTGVVPGFVIRTRQPQEWKRVTADLIQDPEEVALEGRSYVRPRSPSVGLSYFAPDAKTIVVSDENVLRGIIKTKPNPDSKHAWSRVWKSVERGQVAVAVDSSWLRLMVHRAPDADAIARYASLWDKSRAFALGIEASQGLRMEGQADCDSVEDAERVAGTVDAAVIDGLNRLENLRERPRNPGNEVASMPLVLANVLEPLLLEPLLKAARVRVEKMGGDHTVRFESTVDVKPGRVVREILRTVPSVRLARNSQSMNNLKQIAVAMLTIHAASGKFPPAVLMGPDGKTPYSWRVAILPYIQREDLYKQYHFDEPWDGPHNRKLIDQIPEIYHFPEADDKATNSSYFVLTGPGTLFADPNGTGMQSILDGTSVTFMVVEARRNIPWTKPEDIPFDQKGPAPKLGGYTSGGGNAAFSDGAVRFVADTVKPQVLKALSTIAGGEALAFPVPGLLNEPPVPQPAQDGDPAPAQ